MRDGYTFHITSGQPARNRGLEMITNLMIFRLYFLRIIRQWIGRNSVQELHLNQIRLRTRMRHRHR